jgi:hypothetical protein
MMLENTEKVDWVIDAVSGSRTLLKEDKAMMKRNLIIFSGMFAILCVSITAFANTLVNGNLKLLGCIAEDGIIPENYPLTEMDTSSYTARKEKNVVESDGTLILNKGKFTSGTRKTYVFAVKHLKPCLIVQLDAEMMKEHSDVIRWIQEQQIGILNIAGSRESKFPEGIYGEAKPYLERLLVML